jgi:PTH2 family peptidyl-tRNA hydrolase
MNNNTKQVIVVRKFKNLRTGKYCSQVAHASMSFLTKSGSVCRDWRDEDWCVIEFCSSAYKIEKHEDEINHWLQNSFRKICVYVNSEEELLAVHQKALNAGLISHLITDNGATEFNGVPTMTCCAIGPHYCHKFEGLTDYLPLL